MATTKRTSSTKKSSAKRTISASSSSAQSNNGGGSGSESDQLTYLKLAEKLSQKSKIPVLFPPCADILLATLKRIDSNSNDHSADKDIINGIFSEYFSFERHQTLVNRDVLKKLNPSLNRCLKSQWPPVSCAPSPCVSLKGSRDFENGPNLERLFFGDLVWLYYMERMGILQIIGAILDDYATKGNKPISNGADKIGTGEEHSVLNDVYSIILETMTRQMKTGLGSTRRDRNSSYIRCLGWNLDLGRSPNVTASPNKNFSHYFHMFIYHALQYYKDKRLAVAIQNTLNVNKPSVSTKITIRDTIVGLKKAFDKFDYGRNYFNTLNGVIWVIASLGMIRELRAVIGIPTEYSTPEEFIPAAYEMFTGQKEAEMSHNRFFAHMDCANNARAILLNMEALDNLNTAENQQLDQWLDLLEDKIEGYRTAYEVLTGTDLAASAKPSLPMAV